MATPVFIAFVVFIAFIASVSFLAHIVIGSYFPILRVKACRLPPVNWRVNPRLSPLRQILVQPGRHLHSGDPEYLSAGGI